MDVSMTLPTMVPHDRDADVCAWCRDDRRRPVGEPRGPRAHHLHRATTSRCELAAAAALTERVRLWSTIVILPAHDAVAVAKQMASIDVLSGGRLTVGVGVGGREHDYRAISGRFDRRWQRMDEQVAAMRRIWTGEPPFEGADPVGPPPVQPGGPPRDRGRRWARSAIARAALLGRRRRRRLDDGRRPRADGQRRSTRSRRGVGRTPSAPIRRTSRRASGTRSATTPRSACASYAFDYMKIFGEGVGKFAAEAVACFTPDALRRAVDNAARGRAPTSSSSCPPRPTPTSSPAPGTPWASSPA